MHAPLGSRLPFIWLGYLNNVLSHPILSYTLDLLVSVVFFARFHFLFLSSEELFRKGNVFTTFSRLKLTFLRRGGRDTALNCRIVMYCHQDCCFYYI